MMTSIHRCSFLSRVHQSDDCTFTMLRHHFLQYMNIGMMTEAELVTSIRYLFELLIGYLYHRHLSLLNEVRSSFSVSTQLHMTFC